MRISIIIVAHDRKKYLIDAIKSIQKQVLDITNYEIVIIKSFKDELIDSFIAGIHATNIFTEELSLGSKLRLGIEASNGDLLTFLEDDDIFFDGKLKFLIDKFKNKNLGYIHNDYLCLNEYGKPIDLRRRSVLKSPLHMKQCSGVYNFQRMAIKAQGFFNLSCISIRRNLLTAESLKFLDHMQIAVDNFMFYIGCNSGLDVLITNEKYTGYRIHSQNNSFYLGGDLAEFVKKKIRFLESNIYGYGCIEKIISNAELTSFLASREKMSCLAYNILVGKSFSTQYKVKFNEFLNAYYITRSWELFALFLMFKISKIFPVQVKRFYFLYEKMKFTP